MKKVDSTVIKETKYIAYFTFILSLLMQSFFLVISQWDYTVLLGNILGFAAAVGNFFLLGITVQHALLRDEKGAKLLIRFSQALRMLFLVLIALIAYLAPMFHVLAVIIPYLFPRIAIAFRPFIIKK
ncbi:MAG: ATP synthase subunit I [Acutalibacteraceae bacterium]|jgi:hypothetical protein